jgi:predicted permease
MMGDILRDIRHALRLLAGSPGFTATAVLTIGLGVGANTAIFSVINGVFFRPPAVEEPSRLAWLTTRPPLSSRTYNLSYPDYLDYAGGGQSFAALLAYDTTFVAISGDGRPERIKGHITSGNYFSVLGVRAGSGRVFTAEDDAAGSPVVVISHALWKRSFGSDPSVVHRTMIVNGQPFAIVGIAPVGFTGIEIGSPADIWIPFAAHARAVPTWGRRLEGRDASWLRVMGRLRPGIGLDQAQAEMQVVARRIEQAFPGDHTGMSVIVSRLTGGLHPSNTGEATSFVVLLMAVTGLVLLIACANVANLLLARAVGRRREIGIRLALGATRWRLVRQLLTESVVLCSMAGVVGVLMAAWVLDLLLRFLEAPSDMARAVSVDFTVLAFTLALAIGTGVVSGLAPSLSCVRPDLASSIRNETVVLRRGRSRSRLQRVLVTAQVALSMILLVSAGLFLRSLQKAAIIDPGFEPRDRLAMSFDLTLQGYSSERSRAFCRDLLERVEALPGVRSATLANVVPLSGMMIGLEVTLEGSSMPADTVQSTVFTSAIWPNYFRTMEISLPRGRDFTAQDDESSPPVVIVNETAARRFWQGREPLGQRLSLDGPGGPFLEVVAVAKDGKYDDLTEDPRPFLYLPRMQQPDLGSEITLIARTAGDQPGLLAAIQSVLRTMDANLPLYGITTLEGYVEQRNDKTRGIAQFLSAFGSLGLLLAALGLYGVMAYSVAQRTREIGIRMALGARERDVMWMFVGEGLRLTAWGIAFGLAFAAGLTRLLSSMLFGVTATDLATFAAVSILLMAVAIVSSYLPALRASRADPMAALRHE